MQSADPISEANQIEVFIVKTLTLQPTEKSARRARLVYSRPKPIFVPHTITRSPYSLACPELYLVRFLGNSHSHELRVCPASTNPERATFHPLGIRRFIWRQDLLAKPPVKRLSFDNPITGELLCEVDLDLEALPSLPAMQNFLGEQFEMITDLDRHITIKKGQEEPYLVSTRPRTVKVQSLTLRATFFAQVQQQDTFYCLHQILLFAWRRERFDSLGLIPMIRRHQENGKPLDTRLLLIAKETAQDKLEMLGLFLNYFLSPINRALCTDGSQVTLVTQAMQRTKTFLSEWRKTLEQEDNQENGTLFLRILSHELTDFIPLEGEWWTQIKAKLSPKRYQVYKRWLTRQHSESYSPAFGGVEFMKDFSQLLTFVLKLSTKPTSNRRCSELFTLCHHTDAGMVDVVSTHAIGEWPKLKLTSEYPWVSLQGPGNQLLRLGQANLVMRPPFSFFHAETTRWSRFLAYSDPGLAARLEWQGGNSYVWRVIAQPGWLLKREITSVDSFSPAPNTKVFLQGAVAHSPLREPHLGIPFGYTQIAASREDLFLLRIQYPRYAIVRIPIRPNNPKGSIYLLEEAAHSVAKPLADSLRQLLGLTMFDPRYSLVFSYISQLKCVAWANLEILPPEGFEDSDAGEIVLGHVWWKDISKLAGWRFQVVLTAVQIRPTEMRTVSCCRFVFSAADFWMRIVGFYPHPRELFGDGDAKLQFRWQYSFGRLFGVWIRGGLSYVVFTFSSNRFTVAAERTGPVSSLAMAEWLVPTSFRADQMPTLAARVHSWGENEPIQFRVRQIRFVL